MCYCSGCARVTCKRRWQAFADVTFRLLAERIISMSSHGLTYVEGDVTLHELDLPKLDVGCDKRYHVFCSGANLGSLELVNDSLHMWSGHKHGLKICTDPSCIPQCSCFLLYLNAKTWTSASRRQKLCIQLEQAMQAGIRLILAHEMIMFAFPESEWGWIQPVQEGHALQRARHACEFGSFFEDTPQHLIEKGIYSNIASPLKGGAWRPVSLKLIALALCGDFTVSSLSKVSTTAHELDQQAVRQAAGSSRKQVRLSMPLIARLSRRQASHKIGQLGQQESPQKTSGRSLMPSVTFPDLTLGRSKPGGNRHGQQHAHSCRWQQQMAALRNHSAPCAKTTCPIAGCASAKSPSGFMEKIRTSVRVLPFRGRDTVIANMLDLRPSHEVGPMGGEDNVLPYVDAPTTETALEPDLLGHRARDAAWLSPGGIGHAGSAVRSGPILNNKVATPSCCLPAEAPMKLVDATLGWQQHDGTMGVAVPHDDDDDQSRVSASSAPAHRFVTTQLDSPHHLQIPTRPAPRPPPLALSQWQTTPRRRTRPPYRRPSAITSNHIRSLSGGGPSQTESSA